MEVNPAQELRLRQQYFFVCASLQDLVRRHLVGGQLEALPGRAAIQLKVGIRQSPGRADAPACQ